MKIKYLFYIFILSFVMINNVYAKSIVKAGENVVQEGTYDSVRFVAGNRVIDKATIDGISFVAGNEITLEGNTPYGFYAGNIINVNEKVEKDVFIAGNNITIGKDAIIGRDIYLAGNSIVINTNVARDLRVGASIVDLSGITIGGNAYIDADEIIMDSDTVIVGKLSYLEGTNVNGIDFANIGKIVTRNVDKIEVKITIKDIISNLIISIVAGFITISIIFYMMPNLNKKVDNIELDSTNILKTIAKGLVVVIVIPIVCIITLFTGILTPISLIIISIYIISIYLSSLIASYIIGKLLIDKLMKKENLYLSLICGVTLIKIINFIPVIGWIITTVSVFYGMGIIYNYILSEKKD